MKTICLIVPYFGKFKAYFQFFLNSCASNNTIDWLIYTDVDFTSYVCPQNVKVKEISFDKLKEKIQKNFDFSICLDRPYKLCDYKPAYGEIFCEELQNYDYWGYCDCDLIWGDIRKFVTDEILESNDRVFSRGHLSIFKNSVTNNMYYRKQMIKSYETVYQSNDSFLFDEWPGTSLAWEKDQKKYYDDLVMDDILPYYDGFLVTKRLSGLSSPYHKQNIDESARYRKMKNVVYFHMNGKLYRYWTEHRNVYFEEVCYAHFQKRELDVSKVLSYTEGYIIANNKIYDMVDCNFDYNYIKHISGKQMSINNILLDLKTQLHILKQKLI